eukprot:256820-Rhodomonas_salina.1
MSDFVPCCPTNPSLLLVPLLRRQGTENEYFQGHLGSAAWWRRSARISAGSARICCGNADVDGISAAIYGISAYIFDGDAAIYGGDADISLAEQGRQ